MRVAHDVIDGYVAGRVRQLNRAITARDDQEQRAFGVTANQLTILAAIAVLAKSHRPDCNRISSWTLPPSAETSG